MNVAAPARDTILAHYIPNAKPGEVDVLYYVHGSPMQPTTASSDRAKATMLTAGHAADIARLGFKGTPAGYWTAVQA